MSTTTTTTEPPLKTYRGSCHCGAFIYEVEAPEITSAGDCNCSICYKRGYLWLVPKKPLNIVKDEGKLVGYSFGSKALDHQVRYFGTFFPAFLPSYLPACLRWCFVFGWLADMLGSFVEHVVRQYWRRVRCSRREWGLM
jgi:hypothetical protein